MTIDLPLQKFPAKIAMLAGTLVCRILLGAVIFSNFVVNALADERAAVSTEVLGAASSYFPASARLNARFASAEMQEPERDVELARFHASRAVALSPSNYNNRTLLAYIDESRGDRAAAEDSLEAAMRLAPNSKEVRWRLANLLLREGKLSESEEQFRAAVSADPSYVPNTIELLWLATGGDVQALEEVAGNGSIPRFALAQFLLKRAHVTEAVSVFGKIDPRYKYDTPEGSAFLVTLMKMGYVELARALWTDVISPGKADRPLVWNGGFESDVAPDFSHFDWAIASNPFARISIDEGLAHSGKRSLKVEFTGRDTARLDDEIKQLVVTRPGARYRLACYVKTEDLVTPEGPRIVVIDQKSLTPIASTDAVSPGSNDWTPLWVDFAAPQSSATRSAALIVGVRRIPKFSYDTPTSGTVWIDDFTLTELQDKSRPAAAKPAAMKPAAMKLECH